jgi:predicted small lipoprotein YifL
MSNARKNRVALLAALVVSFAGCETKGPAERAGENIDKGIQNAKDAINPPGPSEKAGRSLDNALKP